MAKDTAIEPTFSFIGGLNTEASELNYPANASLDEVNFDLKRSGSREKRLGIDIKANERYSDPIYINPNGIAIQTYTWEEVGSSSVVIIFIVQVGQYLYCYTKGVTSLAVINTTPNSTIDLSEYQVQSDVQNYKVSFAEAKGRLLVAGEAIEPFYLQYDATAGSVTQAPSYMTGPVFRTLSDTAYSGNRHSLFVDNVNELVYFTTNSSATDENPLFKYDTDTGLITSINLTTNANPNRYGLCIYSSGGEDEPDNRYAFVLTEDRFSSVDLNSFTETKAWTAPDEDFDGIRATDTTVSWFRGTQFQAYLKADITGALPGTPTAYTQNASFGVYEKVGNTTAAGVPIPGTDNRLLPCKKTADDELAFVPYTISSGGGSLGSVVDSGITAANWDTVYQGIYDTVSGSCWFLYMESTNAYLLNVSNTGTVLSTTLIDSVFTEPVLTIQQQQDLMFFDATSNTIYITDGSDVWVYDITNSNMSKLKESTNISIMIGLMNSTGKVYSGSGNSVNSKTELYEFTVPSEQQVQDTRIRIKVRDFEGVEDNLDIDARPSNLSAAHEYNLRNQGWTNDYPCVINAGDDSDEDTSDERDPVLFTKLTNGWYPSNADQVQLGKAASVSRPKRLNYFSPNTLDTNIVGNTQAPKGHYIYNAFNMRRSNGRTFLTSLAATFNKTTSKRPSAVAFYAGRAWYAGVNDEEYNDHVYFSQILEDMSFAGKCYQEADPTAEHISDLVDTDGGVIKLAGAKRIIMLKEVGDSLVVGATNGIWTIKGNSDDGFTATGYQAPKISDNGMSSPYSAVDAEGTMLYWSEGGIYSIVVDPNSGKLTTQNLTVNTIQTFYNDISAEGKEQAFGYYDNENKKVIWLYKDSAATYLVYNKALIYDPVLQAFIPYEFEASDTLPRILGIDNFILGDTNATVYDIVVQGDNVQTGSGTNDVKVTIEGNTASNVEKSTHYLTLWPDGTDWDYAFADLIDTNFKDWTDAGTTNYYDAYVETGQKVNNDAVRAKQTPYIGVICERTETDWDFTDNGENFVNPSSCQMTTKWDFYDNTASNKWQGPHQVYRFKRYVAPDSSKAFDNFYPDIIVTKNKVRGRGKALRIRFASEDGKDLKLLGWQIFWTGNTNP